MKKEMLSPILFFVFAGMIIGGTFGMFALNDYAAQHSIEKITMCLYTFLAIGGCSVGLIGIIFHLPPYKKKG